MANQLLFSTSSDSSLLLLHLPKPHNRHLSLHFSHTPQPQYRSLSLPSIPITPSTQRSNLSRTTTTLRVASKTPPDILTVGLESEGVSVSVEPENAGGSGGGGFEDLGGGGGGGGGGDNSGGGGGEGEEEGGKDKKKMMLSMSQKLTLGYAALVGVGGVMGYMKSGSQKSLLAGGISSGLLYYVYTQLPSNPTFASSLGLGVSAALLGVMGSRFKKSGKIFPAGIVSLVSLIMTGGYLHGILRTAH